MTKRATTGLTRVQIEALEREARKLLGIPNAKTRTYSYACVLDDDPKDVRAMPSATPIDALEHPTRKGEYYWPDARALRSALSDDSAREKADAATLDAAVASAAPLPQDWDPDTAKPADTPKEIDRDDR